LSSTMKVVDGILWIMELDSQIRWNT
jgi:hypothetical protein